jgi:hypothetical protein
MRETCRKLPYRSRLFSKGYVELNLCKVAKFALWPTKLPSEAYFTS